jgi:hypothetical protein
VLLGSLRTLPEAERYWHFDDNEAAEEIRAAAVGKVGTDSHHALPCF